MTSPHHNWRLFQVGISSNYLNRTFCPVDPENFTYCTDYFLHTTTQSMVKTLFLTVSWFRKGELWHCNISSKNLRYSLVYTFHSYTPRTLRTCCSQSKFRILKIRESSARALFLYNCIRTSRAVLTPAWASRRVDLRERRIDLFSKRQIKMFRQGKSGSSSKWPWC